MGKNFDVKAIRDQLKLSREDLARLIDVNVRTLIRWETTEIEPRGPARQALMDLLGEQTRKTRTRSELRVGICAEFFDTTLPILCRVPTNTLRLTQLPPIVFTPVPWDDRSLFALLSGMVDIIYYNEYCTTRFRKSTMSGLVLSTRSFESGQFYLALSNPGAKAITTEKALELIFSKETLFLLPPADMQQAVNILFHQAQQARLILPDAVDLKKQTLWCQPGQGLSIFLNPPSAMTEHPIVFSGGQDQRAAIMEYIGQNEAHSNGIRIVLQDELKELGISFPVELSRNCYVTKDSYDAPSLLEQLVSAVDKAKKYIADHIDTSLDDSDVQEATIEIGRWQQLYSSRFTGQQSMDLTAVMQGLLQEYEHTAGPNGFSKYASEWKLIRGARAHEGSR